VDVLLLIFAALSTLSAVFSPNHWLSMRALAITLSGLVVFWAARAVAGDGLRRPLTALLLVAVVAGTGTALAQAYGFESDWFTQSRAPGGTFGNRNFMAHLSAIGAPLLVWYVATARRAIATFLCGLGGAVLAAGLVLSRSRAAWLALLVIGALLAIPTWRAVRRVPHAGAGVRVMLLGVCAAIGVVVALVLPNRLNWKSDSPYLDSVRGVVAYNSGSGRGRVIQYRTSLDMALTHPLLGVGPGNWPVYYPRYAGRNDPSLLRDTGVTANPWPSSDWVALVAERGIAAALVLVIAAIGLVANAFSAARGSAANNPAARDPFLALALTGTVLITASVGMFDAVLLIAPPTLIVWAILGALSTPGRTRREWAPSPAARRRWGLVAAAVLALVTARSATQLVAMEHFGTGESVPSVQRASHWDPGSFRIQLRLAQLSLESRGCEAARPSAARASGMLPSASEPKAILRRCGRE
jgi:O-antigen ligase